jgi:hypothetical protein
MASSQVIEIPTLAAPPDTAPGFPLPAHNPLYLDRHVGVPAPPNLLSMLNAAPAVQPSQPASEIINVIDVFTDNGPKQTPIVAAPAAPIPDKDSEPTASFLDLFRFASTGDKVMVASAFFLAVLHGACLPAFSYVFGEFMDTTGSVGPNELLDRVSFLASIMVGIGVFAFFASGLWTALFAYSSQKQGARIRTIYLASIIGKDCAWYRARTAATHHSHALQRLTTPLALT